MQNLQAQHQWYNSNSNSNSHTEIQRTRLSSPTFEPSGEHSNKTQVNTMILDPTKGPSNGTEVFIPKLHKASSRRRRKLADRNAYINWGRDNKNENRKGANDAQLEKLDSPEILPPEEWSYDAYG
ncbi:hypothetical protein LIER_14423 [Lithospermum erythrorhizon]|uniref:Uncharacterized protein n=1 Tax=Lithospermum erythrorhizon TaxID=34254 RepID=A0AAV3PZ25_LITER